ncbi:LOW QUALITY PROTEIN: nestin [Enhydra lutris kenyoni]|uniref:Nestin n=1 Tax=Enhydra lutris kenyoni TaxID=391180 RepID=A0A2Y9IDI0_ENHLU|nr:LOW QUALITY PROTEIN: nestin [Enhydra lutris kenyoni]
MEGCLGEESFQMWELNRRLEAYLARVKALEEQNELLGAELGGLRAQTGDASWRARADDELAALRALVDQRWREKHAAEVARDNLAEEVAGVAGQCQQQRLARERAAAEAARIRRAAEAEKCAQTRLSARAAELERELEVACAAHEEERAVLSARPRAPSRPAAPRGPPVPAPELEELARQLGDAWRGAVRGYQERVARMETSLGQARERLGRAVQGAREGRLELQQLQAERDSLRERRAALEQRLEGCWQERLRATEKFQSTVEALEQEKLGLQGQTAQVLAGRRQLAELQMSLSLEVATYRTLLEAENSRLQTAGGVSKASLCFQDPKLELHFPGTPEGRHLGPLLSALSPTSLSLPLPDTLETPVPGFLKSREFLQARTPTLASTPIPPTLPAPCTATDAEIRTQDAPLSLLQPQIGREQAPEAMRALAIPSSILPGPEEPGGEQQEVCTGQSSEDHTSLAPPLSPDPCSLEAKGREPSESRMASRFQDEGEGQIWGLAEKETATEVKMVNSLQQETQQEDGGLNMKEIQDSQGPLEEETLKSVEEEIQEPLMSLEKQSHETLRSLEENPESLRSLEEERLDTSKGLEKENQELLTSLEEKDAEVVRPLEKETQGLLKPVGKEDPQTLQSLEKENRELMGSLEGNVETFLYPEKENHVLVRSLEENFESMRDSEKENQEPLRSLEDENLENLRLLEKENQESLNSPEGEKHKTLRPPEKENQEPVRCLEKDDQGTLRPLEKENQDSLRSLEEEDQESVRPLEEEYQEPVRSVGEEDQATLRPLEKVKPEPQMSLGKDQEIFRSLENENQQLLWFLKEESSKTMRSSESENLEPPKSAGDDLGILKSLETQEPLWSPEEMNQETTKPLDKEIQEPLESVEDGRETQRPLEKEAWESLGRVGKWNLENRGPPEELGQESQRSPTEEETPAQTGDPEPLRSLKEAGQQSPWSAHQQGWDDALGGGERDQDSPPGRAAAGQEAEAKPVVRESGGFMGKEEPEGCGQLWLAAAGEARSAGEGHPGSPEPQEQRAPVEGASGEGGTEGFLDPEGPPEQVWAPGIQPAQGVSEARELVLEGGHESPGGDQASPEVTLGLGTAAGESAAGSWQGPEWEVGGLEDPGCPAREEGTTPPTGKEGLEGERRQGSERSREDPEEAAALDPELSTLSRRSVDPLEPSRGREEAELEAPWGAESGLPAETEGPSHTGSSRGAPQPGPLVLEEAGEAELVLGPTEPRAPTPIPGDAPGLQLLAEGSREADLGLEGRAEALGGVEGEQEGLDSEGSAEDLQEGEENREDSEADELGETLPDSTPLGLYLQSQASPRWDPVGEPRPSPQGEARKEGWGPSVPASEGCGAQRGGEEEEDEDENKEEEEECGQESDLSEEFEDLETEASRLPGVPREAVEPLGRAPEPAAWAREGESDGFADEEESGEEGEEDKEEEDGGEPGAGRWGPGSSVGPLPALSGPQRGSFPGFETTDATVPWDDGMRDSAADVRRTTLDTESQDSSEPLGLDGESGPVSLEREDQVPDPLGTLGGVGNSLGVHGQGPSLKEELERVSGGVVNGLKQSEGGGQGKLGGPEGDPGSPLEEQDNEGGALKSPWAGPPLHLGVGQFLKFTPRDDVDSWSSGED